ncbi:MAG: hypothetical protein EKK42_20165 [Pseudonocardiaceae bacterium]|nr:MAG: hypothetical protein EKK42_20165 [Pseudonocardiaceae bacterium]
MTQNAASEYPLKFGMLPHNGDFVLCIRTPEDGWLAVIPMPTAPLTDDQVSQLVHLEPVVTEVPDDLVAQFRAQLDLKDGE